jgi:hypothetical protein
MNKQEIEYLESLLIDVENEIGDTQIPYSEGKVVIGMIGEGILDEYFKCKSIIDTVINLDKKVIYSLKKAISYSYCEEVTKNFNLTDKISEEEFLSFYYIENAMYRTSTLWDCLAQLYNLHNSLGYDIEKIYYKTFFNNLGQSKYYKLDPLVLEINSYLTEDDDTSSSGRWIGNHEYIKRYRNKMTHRNSPDVLSFSSYDLNIKSHPRFVLKRLVEDYNKGIQFFIEIVKRVKEKLQIELK